MIYIVTPYHMSPCPKAHGIYNFGEPSLVHIDLSFMNYANELIRCLKKTIFSVWPRIDLHNLYFMTPGQDFEKIRSGHINHIVKMHYFVLKSSSKLMNIDYSDRVIMSPGWSTKSVNFMTPWYMYECYHMYYFDDVYEYTAHWLLLYLGVTR